MGKDSKSTSTQAVSYPSYVTDAQKAVLGNAQTAISPLLGKSQTQLVADQTPQQQLATGLATTSANNAYNGTNFAQQILQNGNGYQANVVDPSLTGYKAKDVSGSDIAAQMNPYTEAVIQPTLDAMRREYNNNDAKIGAQAASTAAFGGSGAALQRAQAGRDYQTNVASTVGNLLNSAYGAATGVASTNAAAENAASSNNSQQNLQTLLSNQNAQNTALSSNSQQGLTASVDASNAYSQQLANQQAALSGLLGVGTANQNYNQSVLDAPRTAASWYSQFIPGFGATNTTTTPVQQNTLGTLLGAAQLLG